MQKIEMYLNMIINQSSNINSGNVTHKAAYISGHAKAIKKILNTPKYKCSRCKDTGVIQDKEYRGHSEGFVPIEKKCRCRQ